MEMWFYDRKGRECFYWKRMKANEWTIHDRNDSNRKAWIKKMKFASIEFLSICMHNESFFPTIFRFPLARLTFPRFDSLVSLNLCIRSNASREWFMERRTLFAKLQYLPPELFSLSCLKFEIFMPRDFSCIRFTKFTAVVRQSSIGVLLFSGKQIIKT